MANPCMDGCPSSTCTGFVCPTKRVSCSPLPASHTRMLWSVTAANTYEAHQSQPSAPPHCTSLPHVLIISEIEHLDA